MKQKVMLLMLAVVAAMSAQAQIGYKGQCGHAAADGEKAGLEKFPEEL